MYYLIARYRDGSERRFVLNPGVRTLGSRAGNAVVLDCFGVSGRHAELDVRIAGVTIRDLESTNGTFVNGRKIERARLEIGDRLLIGTVLLTLQEALSDRFVVQTVESRPDANDAPAGAAAVERETSERFREMRRVEPGPTSAATLDLLRQILGDGVQDPEAEVYDRALQSVLRLTRTESGCLVETGTGGEFLVRACQGMDLDARLSIPQSAIAAAVRSARVQSADAGPSAEGGICAPLTHGGRVAGVLYLPVESPRREVVRRAVVRLAPLLSVLSLLLQQARARAELLRSSRVLASGADWIPEPIKRPELDDDLIGESEAIRALRQRLELLAASPGPVFLYGEPGSGTARAARRLHVLGRGRDAPFLALHGGTVPPHELGEDVIRALGAASAVRATAPRRDPLAVGGTVFVDEVADVPPDAQRVLASRLDGNADAAGGSGGARLVIASRTPLDRLVAGGLLLRELAGHFDGRRLWLPPLRERPMDIVPLAQHYIRRYAGKMHKRVQGLSADACRALREYRWHGNLLELQNVMHRAVVRSDEGIIDLHLLPDDIVSWPDDPRAARELSDAMRMPWLEAKQTFERAYLEALLDASHGNVSAAAKLAGIARKNLYYQLHRHGLLPAD